MSGSNWLTVGNDAFLYSQQLDGYIPALADWVECQALAKVSFGCDKTTLVTALKIGNWQPPAADLNGTHDSISEDVFIELASRADDYKDRGYPFDCDYSGRRLKFSGKYPWPYAFLLALSYTHPNCRPKNSRTGAYIFEALAWTGMARFFGDPAPELVDVSSCHHLGTPSLSNLPHAFNKKIEHFASEFREGGSYNKLASGHTQTAGDNGIDVLVRRGFPDRRGAQFLYFGACAAGHNWASTKRYECDPQKFLGPRNFRQPFIGHRGMGQCYFLPRQIGADAWQETAQMAGMVIDRCRLSLITHKSGASYLDDARKWTEGLYGKAF